MIMTEFVLPLCMVDYKDVVLIYVRYLCCTVGVFSFNSFADVS